MAHRHDEEKLGGEVVIVGVVGVVVVVSGVVLVFAAEETAQVNASLLIL